MILEHIEVPYDFCFDSRNIWTIVFPVESEKIISTTTRASHEVVHTQAKIIADQDVMYKYISNNLLFVATVQPKAAGPIGSATPEESGLVVYLIDTITGRILHRMNHYGAQGPVRAVCLNSSPFCSLVLPYVSYNQCVYLMCMSRVRTGLFTTTSISELTGTRCQSLRFMISPEQYSNHASD